MPARIGIAGITGRMGHLLAEEVRAAGAELVGGVGRVGSGKPAPAAVALLPDLAALAGACEVVIDFTNAATVQPTAAVLAAAGTAWVLGSSGLSDADEAAVAEAARRIPVVYASNFSAGVNLVLALAERMGAALPADAYDAEIVEMHHRQKVDAPSGTALLLARAAAEGRGGTLEELSRYDRMAANAPRDAGTIGYASLRGGSVAGDHMVVFAGDNERIELGHRAENRGIFAQGAVKAAQWLVGQPAGRYAMTDVLGL